MRAATFECAQCGGVFEKAWTENDAQEDANARFPGLMEKPAEDRVVVCEDCYGLLVGPRPDQGGDER